MECFSAEKNIKRAILRGRLRPISHLSSLFINLLTLNKMKKNLNQIETKALCDAFSFLAMTCVDFKPEHFEQAIQQLRVRNEVLRDIVNDDVARHFRDLCEMRMGVTMVQNDFKQGSRIPDKYPKYDPAIHKTTLRLYPK